MGRVTSQTELKVTFKSRDAAKHFDWDAALAGTSAMPPAQPLRTDSAADAFDATRIGDYTFPKALRELEEAAKDPKANALAGSVRDVPVDPAEARAREGLLREHGHVFTATAALLRAKPETIPLALAAIRRKSPAATMLLDALSSAGTPQAQHALVGLMNDERSGEMRGNAAFALMRVTKATQEAINALAKHLDGGPLQVFALYGLGTISRHLREAGDAPTSAGISRLLTRSLAKADTPALQVHVLRGIANSGDPASFDGVKPFFTADLDKVRAAAVDAVRLMQRPDVDSLVAERLDKDVQLVQLAALDAIAVRDPSDVLVQALERAARKAEQPVVRVKAVRVAGEVLPKRPDLKSFLEALAQDSEYEQVRKAATSALGN
jgi:hypothetical protein